MASRSKQAARNIIFDMGVQIAGYILTFVTRTFFIRCLGEVYLGINGVISNILSILSLAELGFSTAFSVSLYKPLHEQDYETLSAIMRYFRKIYLIVGLVVLGIGLIFLPFIPLIVKVENVGNLYLIFSLYLISSVITYLGASYSTFIFADKRGFIVAITNLVKVVLLNLFQLLSLLIFKNFYLYIGSIIVSNAIAAILCFVYYRYHYKDIYALKNIPLNANIKKEIKTNTKATLFHKIGGVVLTGTDNIVISAFISVAVVGYYSNYVMIISIISTMLGLISNALSAFVGEISVTENRASKTESFYKINFLNYILTGICGVILFVMINPFIRLWAGENYVLSNYFVVILAIQFYLNCIRRTPQLFNTAFGLYDKYKYFPIIEAVLNIIISIILVHFIGLIGVILGTIISVFFVTFIAERVVVFKYAVDYNTRNCLFFDLYSVLIFAICCIGCYYLTTHIIGCESWLKLFINFGIVTIIVLLVYLLFTLTQNYGRWWLHYIKTKIFSFKKKPGSSAAQKNSIDMDDSESNSTQNKED